ncbi:PEP/pyruvate-binding domain-containing protein [Sunxiuqinia elliptica]|uniref:Pyruvate phosphate dikinase-like enzyme n=1 Tax=Sunxiuqinia elliptica TaxID=655355 RepID=A0A4R6GRF0_9BACT|nr:PEP/pyruvate-binding domain-containing protein [Sunxiuqinia elliptica]TDN97773.1 pyruvate phosphate dikinase-like enzyme [Sunxiuqinia elliptica]TDO55851.1 pyruvate phosphate dikinase-like enzyme [Sunxiuqinia elliptica]
MENLEDISLSSIYKRKKSDRDIFEELMPTKVKEVLLVATLYDSYSIVREGQFTDKIFGEFLQLNLYTYPRFTSVNSETDALQMMKERDFDLVIIMVGMDKDIPVKMADVLHEENDQVPILLLVNNNGDLRYFQEAAHQFDSIDRVFVWNGNSNVFLAMVKYIEDKKNIETDIKNGSVRMLLLVEDSIQYYSRYLPMLYTNIMTQTQNLVQDESTDDLHMILKMRARPKVILVSTYEEAIEMLYKYRDYLLSVISDVKFSRNGVDDSEAGVELLKYVKQVLRFPVPLLLQSHDVNNAARAREIGAEFINKNSESLSMDIHNFIYKRLGFGNFVFKDMSGNPIMVARNLQEFQEMFRLIPDEALLYHGKRNSFSTWLMARGEINIAEQLLPYRFEDFKNTEELRDFCLDVFEKVRVKQMRGRIINFDPAVVDSDRYIVRMGKGSLGGKGRGMAFMSNFIENIDFKKIIPDINIRIPSTAIIGAIEFDKFLELNNLYEEIYCNNDYEHIKTIFLESHLSEGLKAKLFRYIEVIKGPLAVRSSGLFEDSLLQPFSGVYATYLLPNNHPDKFVRYQQLVNAIKLVYASIFTESAIAYFDAVNYKIEEEKMAVIIQQVVGREHDKRFYPSISGVAQSYNYYPVSYMKPDDGFAVAAIGLGMYVVGGEQAFRFCPKYPTINPTTVHDLVRDSQREFYAIDMAQPDANVVAHGENAAIKKFRIKDAEADGLLQHCASVFDFENDDLVSGVDMKGPRVVDFANILKYNYIPLAETLRFLLRLFREAMGSPVEMEYAVDLEKGEYGLPTFYLLQIKPLIRHEEELSIDLGEMDIDKVVLFAKQGMGNGEVDGIRDVVFVDPAKFDKLKTRDIAREIHHMNKKMDAEGKEYILIGPGRWGTKDQFTGVPVVWAQISRARIIVEMGLPDFPLDGSLGSHFFHNVTSMNVGYFAVKHHSKEEKINIDMLEEQPVIEEMTYVKHVRFDDDLKILMDGRSRQALISKK